MDTLRPKFEEAAGAFAEAGRRLDGGASAESILASGEPEQIEAWRALPQAQAKADSIRGLVRLMVVHFGVVRTTEYTEDHAQAAFFSASSAQLIQAGHAFGGTPRPTGWSVGQGAVASAQHGHRSASDHGGCRVRTVGTCPQTHRARAR
ncbi:hypothetical protein ACETU7_05750 [Rhodococcus sp. 3Y1]